MPPTRVLAKDLGTSRSTILKAYELLILDEYLISKQGSGYYINNKKNILNLQKLNIHKNQGLPNISKKAKLFIKNRHLITDDYSRDSIAFRPGLPPLDLFPVKQWKALSNNYWNKSNPSHLSYAPTEGLEHLRLNIANYLKVYRNIDCDYNQIIIVSGSLHSSYLIGNTLIDKDDTVVMENPTFPRAYKLFKSLKAKIIPCEIDKNGINIDSIKNRDVKLIYTTPSNQYPLSIKMSLERRYELLNWASKNNSLIIEDDYDHEFSNWDNPIPSIFSLDKQNRVIYQGTFNKLLHPSLRLGYMIVPKYLINPIKSIYEQSSRFMNSSTQEILADFIEHDYLNKHIRNVIKTSLVRKSTFINATKEVLNIDELNSGLHFICNIKNKISDHRAYKLLLQQNVIAYPLSFYYITKEKKEGLVMGYSSVNKKVIKEKAIIINETFK